MSTFRCARCNQDKPVQTDGGTGYASNPETDEKTCYACCADVDREYMSSNNRITLYLVKYHKQTNSWAITNWPSSLVIRPTRVTTGRHNIAGKRYDCWFRDHEGKEWHGVQYGDNTQLVHCRKLKAKS